MADNDSKNNGPSRKLSRFLCQEMLYDYISGNLDESREAAVKETLESDPGAKEEYEAIKKALEYCENLSTTKISEPLMVDLKENRFFLNQAIKNLSWREWPDVVKWTSEALIVSLIVAVLASIIPWDRFETWLPQPKREVILAEVEKSDSKPEGEKVAGASLQEDGSDEKSPEGPFPDEDPGEEPKKADDSEPLVASGESSDKSGGQEDVGASQSGSSQDSDENQERAQGSSQEEKDDDGQKMVLKAKSKDGEEVDEKSDISNEPKKTKVEVKDDAKKKAKEGILYRIFMFHAKIDQVTPKMRKAIQELGGKKAGQVPLGWRKPSGSYFHFTLQESKKDALEESLQAFGSVRIYKDPHPRVMPDGIDRFILWVEDKNLKKNKDK